MNNKTNYKQTFKVTITRSHMDETTSEDDLEQVIWDWLKHYQFWHNVLVTEMDITKNPDWEKER